MQEVSRKGESRIYETNIMIDSTKSSPFLSSEFNLEAILTFFGNLSCKHPTPPDVYGRTFKMWR